MLHACTVTGGGGARLLVEHGGNPDGPVLVCLHGFNQCGLCWDALFASALADVCRLVRLDMRGHGRSDKPADLAQYRDSRLWAADVQAIIDALQLDRPVLLGWSYGGYVMCDYVRHHGQEQLGGLVFVGAPTEMNTDVARALLSPAFLALGRGLLATDAAASMAALEQLVGMLTREPLPAPAYYTVLGYNAAVPPHVRRGLFTRTLSNADLLAQLHVPVLALHGADDRVVLPSASDFIVQHVPHARKITYPRCGHAPFWEATAQFAQDVAAFVQQCASGRG